MWLLRNYSELIYLSPRRRCELICCCLLFGDNKHSVLLPAYTPLEGNTCTFNYQIAADRVMWKSEMKLFSHLSSLLPLVWQLYFYSCHIHRVTFWIWETWRFHRGNFQRANRCKSSDGWPSCLLDLSRWISNPHSLTLHTNNLKGAPLVRCLGFRILLLFSSIE